MHYKINDEWLELINDRFTNLDELFDYFHLSRKTIHLLKQNKEVLVNNEFKLGTIHINDTISIKCFKNDIPFVPTKGNISIVYEDDFLVIINKGKNINVHPDSPSQIDTLSNYLAYHYKNKNISLRYIHRLDFDTTGLILFSKCSLIQPLLDYELSIKNIHRYYIAYVEGVIKKGGTINKPIARDRHNPKKMRISPTGKEAITHYKVLNTSSITKLECKLDTGRTHQIRVHLASIGHPIIGDPLYNPKRYKTTQALHAYKLELVHPITNKFLTITCKDPYAYMI